MLEEIRIRDLGVIEESVLELGPGFTAVTGETGAGKTMVVTALGLLMGGRADSSAVRNGASRARVEGVVQVDQRGAGRELLEVLESAGADVEDGRVLLARQVSLEGRSRAFAGGSGVPASVLAEAAEAWVTVHGQSDQHQLLRPAAQCAALDRYAGEEATALRDRVTRAYTELRAVQAELTSVEATRRERAQEADLLRFGLEEVARIAPQPGEDGELAAEESRLGFADELRTAAETARAALSGDGEAPDAVGCVGAARRLLDGVREHDPRAAELADRVAELGYLLSDVATDVASYASGLETDPARLSLVSQRRAELAGLLRKYGDSVDEVLAWAARAQERVLELDGTDDLRERLSARRAELEVELADAAMALSEVRAAAALALGAAVTEELHALAMPHASFSVEVDQREAPPEASSGRADGNDLVTVVVHGRRLRVSAHGVDEVEMQLAANVGGAARALSRSASGGELSRVMLALEVVLGGSDPVPTMVFDEVDAGVGGRAAVEVGRRLAVLARTTQVVAVTHLPQVAAFADHHVVVAKAHDGSVTRSGLTLLDDAGRVRELSRMLAGQEDSETARAHAEELLESARSARGGSGRDPRNRAPSMSR